jgi:hypothetical protein
LRAADRPAGTIEPGEAALASARRGGKQARRQVCQACRGDRAAVALRRQQLRRRDQRAAFAYMRAYPRIELAPLARISAVDEPVAVAARRSAFLFLYRRARKIFVKAGFNPCCASLNRLMPLAIHSRRQNAFARLEGSFPGVNIRCRKDVRACHPAHVV